MALQFTPLERAMERIKRRRLGAQTWRGVLKRFGTSGLTVHAFCRRESISAASFYRWRRLLGAATDGDTGMSPRPATAPAAGFVDLGTLGARMSTPARLDLKLDFGGGLTLHLVRG